MKGDWLERLSKLVEELEALLAEAREAERRIVNECSEKENGKQ